MSNKDSVDLDYRIGSLVQKRRIELGLSRHQLAREIGVTHQQTQKYEKGINRISAGRLGDIAKALKVPVSYFFDGEEIEVPNDRQRLCIEVSRNLAKIKNDKHLEAIAMITRTLAADAEAA